MVKIAQLSILVVVPLAVGIGCGSSSRGTSTGATDTARAQRPIPAPLAALEASSEDVIDLVPAGNWAGIARDVTDMRDDWRAYESEATALSPVLAGQLDKALGALARESAARDGLAVAQAANDVSAPVVELFARYDVPHPVEIGRLDVIGRQIVIDASRRDAAGGSSQVAEAALQWSSLKPDVVDHGGGSVAADADAAIEALSDAAAVADFASLTNAANALLEIVDEMERLY